jgi:hypothetical protein
MSVDRFDYVGDRAVMRWLGLRVDGFGREWTDLGTVIVEEAKVDEYDVPRPAATVKVEVQAHPALNWRFTVTRPRDDVEELGGGRWRAVYEPAERFEITTRSGGFTEYWVAARLVAQRRLVVRELGSATVDDGGTAGTN